MWVAELRYVDNVPGHFASNLGSKYGLPGPKTDTNSQKIVRNQNLKLQVLMAKKKVSYKRIFPLYEGEKSPWQLTGYTMTGDNLAMLNRDIGVSGAFIW